MKYFSIEVSPKTLTCAVVDDFNRIVDDTANHPLFVYDTDGGRAGGLWYLHFRTAEQDSDEVARIKAERLGLKTDASGAHLDMVARSRPTSANSPADIRWRTFIPPTAGTPAVPAGVPAVCCLGRADARQSPPQGIRPLLQIIAQPPAPELDSNR